MTEAQRECESCVVILIHTESVSWKDTDNGGGEDGEDGSDGDRTLGVFQIPRPVRTSHDSWGKEGSSSITCVCYQLYRSKETLDGSLDISFLKMLSSESWEVKIFMTSSLSLKITLNFTEVSFILFYWVRMTVVAKTWCTWSRNGSCSLGKNQYLTCCVHTVNTSLAFNTAGLALEEEREGKKQRNQRVPVTEGKKMPTRSVKEVVMSANT